MKLLAAGLAHDINNMLHVSVGAIDLIQSRIDLGEFQEISEPLERFAAENFWREVWQSPQNLDAIDRLVHEDFVITSGGIASILGQSSRNGSKYFRQKSRSSSFRSFIETFQTKW